jgi:hypothetical protein
MGSTVTKVLHTVLQQEDFHDIFQVPLSEEAYV